MPCFGTFSAKLARIPGLAALLQAPVVHLRSSSQIQRERITALLGWGQRPSTRRPRALAQKLGLPFIALEDGFLRSWGTGATHPSLSLIADTTGGVYYDATRPSALETLLASNTDLLTGTDYERARELIVQERLGKYNFAPDWDGPHRDGPLAPAREGGVLIVDQTRHDASIAYGLASKHSFAAMLASARREHPEAVIYVKTHPEVSAGSKQGHYAHVQADARTVLLREPVNPMSLIAHMDRVYVVTSHLGFEALLAGVPVTCFGAPWYAGWGATDDRVACPPRRNKTRTAAELFAAAYLHHSRYLNPATHQRGSIFDVIDWLTRQRQATQNTPATARTIAVGYRRWKAENVRPLLVATTAATTAPAVSPAVHFVANAKAAAALTPGAHDRLVLWGANPAPELEALARRSGAALVRMEDGFIRSLGLGSDFVPPQSLVLDTTGLYCDARSPCDLENLLNTHPFSEAERSRAAGLRALILEHRITKYNHANPHTAPQWQRAAPRADKPVILVPGQVEDDASIRYGCEAPVNTNLALLAATRRACPNAFIVYKPHPDVMVRNRAGSVHYQDAMRYANAVEIHASILACIAACDAVHTMTSLTGFDALLRGKAVTTWGRPFYAGWGLTEDRLPIAHRARRTRTLTLDELTAGALLLYPRYWDWTLNGLTTPEATIAALVRQRDGKPAAAAANLLLDPGPDPQRLTTLQRHWRKLKLWGRAGFVVKG